MADVKICGINSPEARDAAIQAGARWLGFVIFPKSPRHVSLEVARALASPVGGRAETVAVTVDADDAQLAAIADAFAPDWIQLHGRESPARIGEARRFARRGIIRAVPIARSEDFAAAEGAARQADMLLFDAKAPPGAALPGGNGAAFDWTLLSGRRFAKPWFLSGGLSPDTVREAIDASAAPNVDVSSGVESAPGVKDLSAIGRFVAAARGH